MRTDTRHANVGQRDVRVAGRAVPVRRRDQHGHVLERGASAVRHVHVGGLGARGARADAAAARLRPAQHGAARRHRRARRERLRRASLGGHLLRVVRALRVHPHRCACLSPPTLCLCCLRTVALKGAAETDLGCHEH